MRNRRGLSPVVSVLLLILIAVAAAVIIYSWFSGAASKNPTNTPQLYERISIEAVKIGTHKVTGVTKYIQINVTVMNIGGAKVNISSIFLLGTSTGNVICSVSGNNLEYLSNNNQLKNGPVPIGPGSSALVVALCKGLRSLSPGDYTVKATTANGIQTTYRITVSKTIS